MSTAVKDLIAWQKAMDLVESVYRFTAKLPREELYGLTSQMRRSAVSIASNIAEGQARYSKKEFVHFLRTARGSLAELETQVIIAGDLSFLATPTVKQCLAQADELSRILAGLIASMQD